jgi:outer membrane protein
MNRARWRPLLAEVVLGGLILTAVSVVPARAQEQAPYTLAQAVNTALTRNPQVVAAGADVRAAEAQLKVVRAGLAPTLALSPSASIGNSSGATTTAAQVSASVSYLVYDGGLRQAQIRQAEAQVESARQNLAATRADVALSAVDAYLAVVAAQQVITAREQAVAQARTQLNAAQARFNAGTAPQADVIQAQSQLASAEFDLVDARATLERERIGLQTALGLDASAPVGVMSPGAPPAVDVTPAEALQRALQRPEALKGNADVRAVEAALAAAMIQSGISATLDGRYVLVSTGGSGSSSGAGTWSVGIGISVPLYDGGKARAQVEEARANLDAARARLESTRLQLRQEAAQALQNVLAGAARTEAAQRALAAAREALRVAQGRYQAGVGTVLEVATAQTDASDAEVVLLQSEADRWVAAATLRRALALSVLP